MASDIALMATGRRALTLIRCRLRQALICASLMAVCGGAWALAATDVSASPLASASSSHSSSPAPHKRGQSCAKRASYNSTSGYGGKPTQPQPHRRRHTGCNGQRKHGKRHAGKHHSAGAACSGTQLRPTGEDVAAVDAATLCLVNRERTSRGEQALRANGDLQHAAATHSAEMATGDYFEHIAPSGSTPLMRMRAAGYIFSTHIGYAIGENIAWGTLWLATPKAIVAGWMASPGHRANILDVTFKETGVGVSPHPIESLARGESGAIYTQDFGRIIEP
jgi:uncharacterized protein YkwD